MASADLLRRMVGRRRIAAGVNQVLRVVLPAAALGLGIEAVRWCSAETAAPTAPLVADLSSLQKGPAAVPEVRFRAELFPIPMEVKPAAAEAGPTQVAVKEVRWRILGIVMTPVRRAYLEDPESKQTVAVGEGERAGDVLVKRIDGRSVLLEKEGNEYEIRF